MMKIKKISVSKKYKSINVKNLIYYYNENTNFMEQT